MLFRENGQAVIFFIFPVFSGDVVGAGGAAVNEDFFADAACLEIRFYFIRVEQIGFRHTSYLSRPMSTAVAEWVIAPTAILSTPHCAMAETLFKVILPEASSKRFSAFASHFISHLDGVIELPLAHIVQKYDIDAGDFQNVI